MFIHFYDQYEGSILSSGVMRMDRAMKSDVGNVFRERDEYLAELMALSVESYLNHYLLYCRIAYITRCCPDRLTWPNYIPRIFP